MLSKSNCVAGQCRSCEGAVIGDHRQLAERLFLVSTKRGEKPFVNERDVMSPAFDGHRTQVSEQCISLAASV